MQMTLKHFSDCLFYFCYTCVDSITEAINGCAEHETGRGVCRGTEDSQTSDGGETDVNQHWGKRMSFVMLISQHNTNV